VIQLEHIFKQFGSTTVVKDVSLRVERGQFLGLLGGSGSGKTTTLQMVNRLVEPTSGRISIANADVRDFRPHLLRRSIGYCFQRVGLFPHLSVADNIGITCTLLGWTKARVDRRVDELLELVELPPAQFRERRPHELSGGQQQRVGVARALAAEPQVILFDEPFGALDPLIRARLQDSVLAIRKRLRLTGMFVTHDVVEAFLLCDKVAVMHAGELVQVGTPRQLIERPVNEYVAQLVQTPLQQAQRVQATFGAGRPLPLGADATLADATVADYSPRGLTEPRPTVAAAPQEGTSRSRFNSGAMWPFTEDAEEGAL
jgi:osmoprotectant transport system ATP-binding protein